MIISNTRIVILLTLLKLSGIVALYSQSSYEVGFLPKVNLSSKLNEDLGLNIKIERRDFFRQGVFGGLVDRSYQHKIMDYSAMLVRNIGVKNRIGLGVLLRYREGDWQHRITQQYVFNTLSYLKLSHRFVTDQTITGSTEIYRLRYRASLSKALDGHVVDQKEWYLKFASEWLNIWSNHTYEGEFRMIATLGHVLSDHNKLELGLDYRVGGIFLPGIEQSWYVTLNWYYRL